MLKGLIIVSLICLWVRCRPVQLLTEDLGQVIFHEDPDYMIYVTNDFTTPNETFTEYCNGAKHGCAYITPDVEQFELFFKFMGVNELSYYLMLNPRDKRKYVLRNQPTGNMCIYTEQSLRQFYDGYKSGTIQPYYSSEPEPKIQKNAFSKQLVGTTFKNFIMTPKRTNIVFFFVDQEHCYECMQALQVYFQIAQYHNSKSIGFGHINIFINQHPALDITNVPSVGIYVKGEQLKVIEKFENDKLQELILNGTRTAKQNAQKADEL